MELALDEDRSPGAPCGAAPLAVEARALRKEYGRRVALQGASLRVRAGEVFGFLGANGAGKTTFVKMLLGLVRPTSGEAHLFGRSIRDHRARRVVGYQPEQFRFPEWMTAEEVLAFHGRLAGVPREEVRTAVPSLLERVGLGGRGRDRVGSYSKGMQQRLALAQALMGRPALVILDEPTSALDPVGRRDVRELIQSLKQEGVATFLNSHLLSEVELVCDRVAILHEGVVIREGRLADLLETNTHLHVRVDALTPQVEEAVRPFARDIRAHDRSIEIDLLHPSGIPAVARALHEAGAEIWELRPERITLEEVFIGVVRPSE